jgi:hypothetical protein
VVGIYVEVLIHSPLEEVWAKTQTPSLHERWDLRFTGINYLPRPDESQPQRFRYTTRVGFGLQISGEGESIATRVTNGDSTSALKFWSNDRKSLILKGSGYWKYSQQNGDTRFLTWYDYQTRFGVFGKLIDRLIFRPLIGWATAWSFDSLRLWIEQGIDPSISRLHSVIHALVRWSLAFIWLYHGFVPKLMLPSADELSMLQSAGIPPIALSFALILFGIAEVALGLAYLLLWRSRRLFLFTILGMIAATFGIMATSPHMLIAAFNPLTLNLCVAVLAFIGYAVSKHLPSARNCLRKPTEHET